LRHQDAGAPAAPLPGASGYRFALIVSRFNEKITHALCDGARAALSEAGAGAGDVEELNVPGAFELPQAARCAAVAHGIMTASGETGVPIAFGVLTTDTEAQAEERAKPGRENKGWEAAAAAIEMAQLFRALTERGRRR
jgi:6,7-dimethyl-8-ribityllumazine synthase